MTPKIGEKLAIAVYLLLSMGLELLFWLIPSFITSAVMAGLLGDILFLTSNPMLFRIYTNVHLGFFLGPLFPAAVVVATKLLPKALHVSAIGFAAAFGGGGAALFPFVVGAIASAKGVQVLQPVVLALLAVIFGLWCTLPGGFKKRGLDMARPDNGEQPSNELQWVKKSMNILRRRTVVT